MARPSRASGAKTVLAINDQVRLVGVPAEAHRYQVNGRIPLKWLIDRYRIARDRESGIVNIPIGGSTNRAVAVLRRAVHLSVETVHVVESLPDPLDARHEVGWRRRPDVAVRSWRVGFEPGRTRSRWI